MEEIILRLDKIISILEGMGWAALGITVVLIGILIYGRR